MTENALSILIVIFSTELQQTEISERKLFIFHLEKCLFLTSKSLFLTYESLFLASECLFLTSESPFISVYNQTLPIKPNLSENLFPFPNVRVTIPNPKVRARFVGP